MNKKFLFVIASLFAGNFAATKAFAQVQQTPTTPTLGNSISVGASATTPIWTYNNSTQILAITLGAPPCVLTTADGTAKWDLVGGGYTFNNYSDKVPTQSLTINCTTAQTIYIAEGH